MVSTDDSTGENALDVCFSGAYFALHPDARTLTVIMR
jgi:hypothetical protein